MTFVLSYHYPGNVRQLESFAEQMVAFADENGVVDIDAIPEELLQSQQLQLDEVPPSSIRNDEGTLLQTERAAIETAVARYALLEEAARELGIGRTTLWRKMRQYNIQRVSSILRNR